MLIYRLKVGGVIMPTCENCHNKWNWKQTTKMMATFYSSFTCPYCEEKQYQTKKSRGKTAIIPLIVLLPFFLNAFLNLSTTIILGSLPITIAIIFIIYPYLLEVGSEEELPF